MPWKVPDWHEDGACRNHPDLDWIGARPGSAAAEQAKAVCIGGCPVRAECALGALERGEPWGVWGGLDRKERTALAKEHGYPVPGIRPEHGERARYVKWGCRCRPCKDGHALYEFERRAKARAKARARGVWSSPLLVLVAPVTIGRRRQCAGQYLLPLALPAPKHAEPEPPALAAAA